LLITDYFREIRETIAACDIVHSFNVAYDQRTDYVGFIRGEVYLLDGSMLHFREFVNVETAVERYAYAYQYMQHDQMVFRYDNTEHHRDLKLSTFPHHRHNGHTGQVTTSPAPNLAAVLSEIRGLLPRDLIAASNG
jgi:hypothetical protein